MGLIDYYFGRDGVQAIIAFTDVDAFIKKQIPEGILLEYKEPTEELASDINNLVETIGAFLNTNGGLLIYGISVKRLKVNKESKKNVMEKQYPDQIVPCKLAITKERLQQLLFQNIEPWNSNIKIVDVFESSERKQNIFLVDVPPSSHAPHMANNRFQFRTEAGNMPMTYRQVTTALIANRAEKSNLIEKVYAPIFTELDNFFRIIRFEKKQHHQFDIMFENSRHLWILVNDGLRNMTEFFYDSLKAYNSEIELYRKTVRHIVTIEAIRHLMYIEDYKIYKILSDLSEKDKEKIEVIISVDGFELNPRSTWVYLSYDQNPVEEFKKQYPQFPKVLSGLSLKICYDEKERRFSFDESRQLFDRCKEVVAEEPSIDSFRRNHKLLYDQARELREEYRKILTQ